MARARSAQSGGARLRRDRERPRRIGAGGGADPLDGLRRRLGLAILFITHDLGVVAAIADHVVVLEQGEVRERGPADQVLTQPVDG